MSGKRLDVHGVGPADLGRTAVALGVAVAVEIGLRTIRLSRLSRWLGVPLATGSDPRTSDPRLVVVPRRARRRLAAAGRALRYWPFGNSCLRVALVGGFLVRDLDPILRIGVAKHDGEIKAHAWLEIGGLSLDAGSVDFAPVASIRA